MLTIEVNFNELWDEEKQVFVYPKPVTLQLQHSLVSISKWESKWHKPFLTKDKRTVAETIDYIKCMTITQNVPDFVYNSLTAQDMQKIADYIDNPMTATWFKERKFSNSSEQVTSELIYYWMICFDIPFECQKWHLNRLLTLIRICEEKNQKKQKMSQREAAEQQHMLNAARRQRYKTKG